MLSEPKNQETPATVDASSDSAESGSARKSEHRYWLLLECQFWVFHTLVLCFCLYLVSLFVEADRLPNSVYSTDQYKYALQGISLWGKGYIVDITEVNTDNCPQGYDELINYVWHGTTDGCFCQTFVNNHASEYILQGACSSELIALGCSTIAGLQKQNMKMWKGGKLLCYKRVSSLSFYNSTLDRTPSGTAMKSCATGKNFETRALPQLACPVSVMSNSSIGSSTQSRLSLDASNSNQLYYQTQQEYPIADFKLSEYSFCPFWPQVNISPNKKGNYILENNNYSATCTGVDPRIIEFDYMTEEAYVTNNTRVYDMLQQLPGYPRPSIAYAYRLGFVRYPAWSYACRVSASHNLNEATRHLQFTHLTDRTRLVLVVGIPCVLIVGVFIRLLHMLRHIFEIRSKREFNMVILTDREVGEQIPNLNIVKSLRKQLCFFALEEALTLATLVVVSIGAYSLVAESEWIKEMFSRSCTQAHLGWIFRLNEDKVDQSMWIVARAILFLLVVVCLQVAHFIIRGKYGDLKPEPVAAPDSLSNEALIKDDINDRHVDEKVNLQDSSDIMLRDKELKVYDIDNFMTNEVVGPAGGETGFNFYANNSIEQNNFQIVKKKKKKGIKRKNLFKDGDEKADDRADME